jgi:hypothetical protein
MSLGLLSQYLQLFVICQGLKLFFCRKVTQQGLIPSFPETEHLLINVENCSSPANSITEKNYKCLVSSLITWLKAAEKKNQLF